MVKRQIPDLYIIIQYNPLTIESDFIGQPFLVKEIHSERIDNSIIIEVYDHECDDYFFIDEDEFDKFKLVRGLAGDGWCAEQFDTTEKKFYFTDNPYETILGFHT